MDNKTNLYKPNKIIMLKNNNITLTQKKVFNLILFNAWHELKKDPTKNTFDFYISDFKKYLEHTCHDTHIRKSITSLAEIFAETAFLNSKDDFNWDTSFTIISYAKRENEHLKVTLPPPILKELIENNYYTTIDLIMIKHLSSKYAICIYELLIRYNKINIPLFSVEELKNFTGTEKIKGYSNFYKFKEKVILPAINEINEKTDIVISFKEIKTIRKVTHIQFKSEFKKNISTITEQSNVKPSKIYNKNTQKTSLVNFEQRPFEE